MKLEQLHGKRILILGYGKEGKATKAFLHKFVPDAFIDVADQNDGPDYLEKQVQFDLAIKTPGIPRRLVTIPYTTATNIFFANLPPGVKTIGVTGSKGKSTTTSLIFSLLHNAGFPAKIAGNIGRPMLTELMDEVTPGTIYVLELSSYQLEDIEFSPDIAVFLNVFPEHLDYHGGLQSYMAAKSNIATHMGKDGVLIYNKLNHFIAEFAEKLTTRVVPFIENLPFSLEGVALKGKHNEDNMRAALTASSLFDVPMDTAQRVLKEFKPLPHRLELVGEFSGIAFYDDAIATAPEPTMFAIETLGNVDTIFLGGTDRGLDFSQLAEVVCRAGIRNVVLFPDTGARIKTELHCVCKRTLNILETTKMEEAVLFAYAHTSRGKSCLMSTASPSYSLWENFEAKGDIFKKCVRDLDPSKQPARNAK